MKILHRTLALLVITACTVFALVGCAAETKTGKKIGSASEAQAVFLQAFDKAGNIHPSTASASCFWQEQEWKCSAHGFSGEGEKSECKTVVGHVTSNGNIGEVIGGLEPTSVEFSECGKLQSEEEKPTESATEAYSHTPAGEASDREHAEENAQTNATTPKAEASYCRESNNPSSRCQALGQLELSERPDNGAKEGSYTDEEGYTYRDNEHETFCSDGPKSPLPTCESG